MKTITNVYKYFIVAVLSFFILACSDNELSSDKSEILLEGRTIGTTFSVKLNASDKQSRQNNFYQDVTKILADINDQMSTYQSSSEISLFNQLKSTEPFEVSPDFINVVKASLLISEQSNNALDITVGPLVNLWGFGPKAKVEVVPSDDALAKIRQITGADKLSVTQNSLVKTEPNLYIDLSAIAKGFAVDKIAEYFLAKGIDSFLVEVGGEMRAAGTKINGKAWRVAIEKPDSQQRSVQQVFELKDRAVATSGDYRNYFEEEGVRYSHTIDPSTGKPISHALASVTVIHESAMMADGYATALNVMGTEKALIFAEQHQLAVYLVVKSDSGFAVKYSTVFEPLLN